MKNSQEKNVLKTLAIYYLKQYFSRGIDLTGSYIDWFHFYKEVFGYSDVRTFRKLVLDALKRSVEVKKAHAGLFWGHVPDKMTTKLVVDTARQKSFPISFLVDAAFREALIGVDFQRRACGYSFAVASVFETSPKPNGFPISSIENEFSTLTIGEYILLSMFWDWKLKRCSNQVMDPFHIEEEIGFDNCRKTICQQVHIDPNVVPLVYNSQAGMVISCVDKVESPQVLMDGLFLSNIYGRPEPDAEISGPREIVSISEVIYKKKGRRLV
ncbi:MAG: hypothetical protein WCF94_03755 [bacterium]